MAWAGDCSLATRGAAEAAARVRARGIRAAAGLRGLRERKAKPNAEALRDPCSTPIPATGWFGTHWFLGWTAQDARLNSRFSITRSAVMIRKSVSGHRTVMTSISITLRTPRRSFDGLMECSTLIRKLRRESSLPRAAFMIG